MTREKKEEFMRAALDMAKQCEKSGDVPVGCVIVRDQKIIAYGRNKREQDNLSIAHAEIEAITMACGVLNSKRLDDCSIFITLEPCPMCAGAILLSNIKNVYIGAMDFLSGACGSKLNIFDFSIAPSPKIEYGILKEQCKALLSDFFNQLRKK